MRKEASDSVRIHSLPFDSSDPKVNSAYSVAWDTFDLPMVELHMLTATEYDSKGRARGSQGILRKAASSSLLKIRTLQTRHSSNNFRI